MIKTTVEKQWRGREVKIQGKIAVGKSAFAIGLMVEGQAIELCARRYGLLAASINTQSINDGTELKAPDKYKTIGDNRNAFDESMARRTFSKIEKPKDDMEVFVGTHVDYGPYVEFGTVKSSAQPFLRPSLDLAQGKKLTIIEIEGKKHLKEYLTTKDRGKI